MRWRRIPIHPTEGVLPLTTVVRSGHLTARLNDHELFVFSGRSSEEGAELLTDAFIVNIGAFAHFSLVLFLNFVFVYVL